MSSITKAFLTLFFALAISCNISAQDYKSSAGLRIGTYIAGSFKIFISETAAIETIAGMSREGGNSIFTFGEFYQIHNQLTSDIPTLSWYLGAGGIIKLGNKDIKTNLLLTAIIGLEYTFEPVPINLFIDGTPYFNVINEVGFDAEASLGVRYVF